VISVIVALIISPSFTFLSLKSSSRSAWNSLCKGLGFFSYIFLIIIVGFSLVGFLKTFENDLLNYFPQTEYIFELLNIQLEYLAESVKNIIVIINDLVNSY